MKLRKVSAIVILIVAVVLVATAVGSVHIPLMEVLGILTSKMPGLSAFAHQDWSKAREVIVLNVRLPRVLLALVVGGGLSVSGVLFQGQRGFR